MKQRIVALDSLRGLAALTVLASHIFLVFPNDAAEISRLPLERWKNPMTWLRDTPLQLLVGGRSAVIIFFVLSGFVLSLAFLSFGQRSYTEFVWRRFCRVYLPFAVAILVAAVMASFVTPGPMAGFSDWFNDQSWTEPVSWHLVARHLLVTGVSTDMSLNNVMWSLVHEIRISLFFPLIMLLVLRSSKASIAVFSALWLAATCAVPFLPFPPVVSFLGTLAYSAFFVAGALLAKHRDRVALWVSELASPTIALLSLTGFLLLAVPSTIPGVEAAYGLGSISLIAVALAPTRFRSFLTLGPLVWLGRVSFSLYLFHLPIVLLSFRKLSASLDPWLIIAIVVSASLLAAEVGYRLIERPAIAFGNRVFAWSKRRAKADAST